MSRKSRRNRAPQIHPPTPPAPVPELRSKYRILYYSTKANILKIGKLLQQAREQLRHKINKNNAPAHVGILSGILGACFMSLEWYWWSEIFLAMGLLVAVLWAISHRDSAGKVFLTVFYVLPMGFLIYAINHKRVEAFSDAYAGILQAANDPVLATSCGAAKYTAFLGSLALQTNSAPFGFIKSTSLGDLLSIEPKSDGSIALNLDIYDREQKVVASIRHGQFLVNRNNALRKESPDKSTLVVYGQYSNSKPALYVHYANRGQIKISGDMYFNPSMKLTSDGDLFVGSNRLQGDCFLAEGQQGASILVP